MKKQVISISTFLACSLTFADVYVVRPGDTASDILFKNVEGRIYGRNGNLLKLLEHNPHIGDPNNIVPGETLRFPKEFNLLTNKGKPEHQPPFKVDRQANKVAERLRHKTEAIPIISDGTRVKVTISVGISLVSEGDNDGHDAIDRADKKLLEAKSSGRNRVCA